MAKFKFSMSMGLVGCRREEIVEIDDQELEGLEGEERDTVIDEAVREWLFDNVDFNWSEVED